MASTAIPLLSSSPPRPFRTFEMPSSPSFPPSTGFSPKRIPILRTGSRATPIPQSAFASFTTAASLLRRTSIDNACGFGIELSFENDAIEQSSILQKRDTPFENGMGTLSANNDDCGVGEVVEAVRKKLVTDGDGGKKRTRKPQTRNARPEEGAFPEQRPLLEPQSKKALVDVHEDRNIRRRSAPKSRVKETDLEVSKDAITKSTAPRKPPLKASSGGSALEDGKRKRKTIARPREKELEIQTKITNSKITKPSIVGRSEKDQGLGSTKQPEIMSRHFTSTSHKIQTPLDIGLIPAIRRRVTWTPPPAANDSILVDTPVAEIGGHKIECSTVDQVIENNGKVFTTLLANFGFSSDSSNAPRGIRSGTATKKRKLIELVRTASSTSEGLSTLNTKVNKKKARTLTEIATSAYARDEDTPGTAAPLLEYFEMQKVDPKTRNCFNDPPMPRAKSPVKKTIKGTKQAPILLSPESALEQVSKQEFVFGTSSQLAREESPSFLRDIHAAMQASNVVEESDVSWGDSLEPTSTILPNKSLGKSTLIAKQGLWSAAARDVSGELLDVEIVDLVESPIIKILRDELLVQKEYPLVANITSQQNSNHLLVNKLPLQDGTRPIGPVEAAIRNELLSSPSGTKVNVARTKSPAKISKQSKSPTTTEKTVDRPFQQKNCPESKMPTFSAYTTSQLNKRISDYRFKPIKSREKMINILERCWEGEQRLALKSLGSNTIVGSSRPKKSGIAKKKARASEETELPSPKRSRGRPKKDNTAILSPRSNSNGINTFENLDMGSDTPLSQIRTPKKHKTKIAQPFEDISDSDTQLAPSPPRRRPSQVCTSPLPIKPFAATAEDVTAPDHLQILLFKHITQAITALSPSKDFKIPCWHEKILLYDPIILEDFTVWLNTGALEKAGWDGEVEPKEVKKWCESKSICCLWKENLRGGVRSRYS